MVLRAVDLDSGKGLPGVEFYEEIAAAEDWAHPIYGLNLGTKFAYDSEKQPAPADLTDNDGILRRWVAEQNEELKFGVWKTPEGYELVEPKGELPILTKLGQARVEQVFNFRRIARNGRTEPRR